MAPARVGGGSGAGDNQSTIGLRHAADPTTAGLSLRILGERVVAWHPLPASGSVVIGRAPGVEVLIDDASISRRHAVVHVGPPLELEDLGSANGTRVQKRALGAGERVPLSPGDVVDLGAVLMVVEVGPARAPAARAAPNQQAQAPESFRPSLVPPSIVVQGGITGSLERLVDRIAASAISVLILGETGVGKEVLAETLHWRSPRADRAFLRINCSSLSETLLESELFGYEKGAFTGAAQAKPGLFETAHGGTVFLDEVGELPASLQPRLLRVLEEGSVLRVGGLKPRPIDMRFIAATNRDLSSSVASGAFRRDLFFRLNGVTITIPPLRDRLSELEALAHGFLAEAWRKAGRPGAPSISAAALERLRGYDWPGNVRELRNVIERAVLLCNTTLLEPEHLPLDSIALATPEPSRRPEPPLEAVTEQATGESLAEGIRALERQRIVLALSKHGGNQTQAAQALGISRGTLLARMEAFGLPRPRKR